MRKTRTLMTAMTTSLQFDRTQHIAQGLGMAFGIRQTYPSTWAADGHYYWTW